MAECSRSVRLGQRRSTSSPGDRFQAGDLVSGISTKDYIRRATGTPTATAIGFVFRATQPIPHQSVLANVELATLTLLPIVPSSERRKLRALDASERVTRRTTSTKTLTGVRAARCSVSPSRAPSSATSCWPTNRPIALDSATSVQVMDLLRDVAHDRASSLWSRTTLSSPTSTPPASSSWPTAASRRLRSRFVPPLDQA